VCLYLVPIEAFLGDGVIMTVDEKVIGRLIHAYPELGVRVPIQLVTISIEVIRGDIQ
jgi:hypothetical protein